MEFGYNATVDYQDFIDIDDIHNTYLIALDEDGLSYFLSLETDCGIYNCLTWGPLFEKTIIDTFSVNYSQNTSESKAVARLIQQFLSSKKRSRETIQNSSSKNKYAKIIDVVSVSREELMKYSCDIFKEVESTYGSS